MLEAAVHPAASFVTLTYDEDHVPDELDPKVLQDWLKRFRFNIGKVRFFGVGEYGERTFRPHFHVALFGYDRRDFALNRYSLAVDGSDLKKSWEFGNVHVGELTLKSAAYVAGYTVKKMTRDDDIRLGGKHPEFARMSLRPGIGFPAISSLAEALSSDAGRQFIAHTGDVPSVLQNGGRRLPLGRYMRAGLRAALGHEFKSEGMGVLVEKTARLRALYEDYVAHEGTPSISGFQAFRARRDAQRALQMEKRAKIREVGKI